MKRLQRRQMTGTMQFKMLMCSFIIWKIGGRGFIWWCVGGVARRMSKKFCTCRPRLSGYDNSSACVVMWFKWARAVIGNASIFARELGNALDLAVCIYSFKNVKGKKHARWQLQPYPTPPLSDGHQFLRVESRVGDNQCCQIVTQGLRSPSWSKSPLSIDRPYNSV